MSGFVGLAIGVVICLIYTALRVLIDVILWRRRIVENRRSAR